MCVVEFSMFSYLSGMFVGPNRSIPEALYIVKGKLHSNVVAIRGTTYYGNPVLSVTFKSRSGNYSRNYNRDDVKQLPFKKSIDGNFRFKDQDGKLCLAVRLYLYDQNAVCAESKSGFLSFGYMKDMEIEDSLLDKRPVPVYDYLHSLSVLNTMTGEDGKRASLKDRYDNNRFVFRNSLLYDYCKPGGFKDPPTECPSLVFPFGFNASQYKAVQNAFRYRLSVIEGPPGTGKTQTILNLLANLVIRGKSCLVVSSNNSAVENVVEKLSRPEYGFGFLVAVLGNSTNRHAFLEGQTGYLPDLSSWKLTKPKFDRMKENLNSVSEKLPAYFESLERLAVLKERVTDLGHQLSMAGEDLPDKRPKIPGLTRLSSKMIYSLLVRMDAEKESKEALGLVTKFLCFFYGFGKKPNRDAMEHLARRLDYYETEKECRLLQKKTNNFKPSYDSFMTDSLAFFRGYLNNRYKGDRRRVFSSEDLSSRDAQSFLKEYPVVTSTTFSATACIDQAIPFDYLIMDEASQVDIVSGALALNTALSAVIVGDRRQLPNVVTDTDAAFARNAHQRSGLADAYRYVENSFLDSILSLFPSTPAVLLREHYRCEPDIIGFCNRQFYGGELLIMTNKVAGVPSVSVIRSVVGNHAFGLENRRQGEEVVAAVREIYKDYQDIGVITPYRNQVELISRLLTEAGFDDVPVATVHKFQGRENDAIILSTVSNSVNDFIDDPHLVNVAVSRAKKRFVLIITGNELSDGNLKDLVGYITYCGGAVRESGIRSIFDRLYSQYVEERKAYAYAASHRRRPISQYATENYMNDLLIEMVAEDRWKRFGVLFQYPLRLLVAPDAVLTDEEAVYAGNSWTKVDFLLFDKVTRLPVLVIEVDGMSFHQEGSEQHRRDLLKNSVLKKSKVDLLRLSTKGSREREQIENVLASLGY